jgi:glycosyltransferase involved in cell wall biosynthesis
MKILHVNMTNSGGGLEHYLLRLSEQLDRRGHENLLLYGEDSLGPHLPFKAKLYWIQGITHPFCQKPSDKLSAAAEIVNRERSDLVFFHQVLNPRLVNFLSSKHPSVRFVHGFKMVCPDGKKTLNPNNRFCEFPLSYLCQARAYLYRCMPRNVLKGLPAISISRSIAKMHRERSLLVVASQFMKNILLCNAFEEGRIAVLPPFTTLPDLEPEYSSDDPPMIISVGRVFKEKGMDYVLQAFVPVKERARLVIIGDGPFLNELKSQAQQLNIRSVVLFTGWLPPEKLEFYYRRCRMVIVPSTWPEPFGMVGIEAMAHSKPVIAFDVGGVTEWLKDGETGFLVKPRDEASLTEKINTLLANPNLAMSMGLKGRKSVEKRFTAEVHVDRLLSIFENEIEMFHRNKASCA